MKKIAKLESIPENAIIVMTHSKLNEIERVESKLANYIHTMVSVSRFGQFNLHIIIPKTSCSWLVNT